MKNRVKGLTSIEWLVAIIIVAVLCGIIIKEIAQKTRISYDQYISQEPSYGAPYIFAPDPDKNQLGGINFPVNHKWNKVDILFTDMALTEP